MAIWKRAFSLADANALSQNTLVGTLGIVVTEIGDDYLTATMPVDTRTHQPFGVLHGGASVALAETAGSLASAMLLDESKYCVGLEINANHLRAVRSGLVTATARPIHVGRRTHVWDVRIENERQQVICVSRLTMAILAMPKSS